MERKLGPFEIPLVLLFILIAVYTYLAMDLVSLYKSLPSPVYGGDYYYQLGAITHMYNVPITEWSGSSNGIGNRPAYFILYSVLVTIFGKLFGLVPLQAIFSFNIILPALSLAAFFLFYRKLFNDSWLALLGAAVSVSIFAFPLFKYTDFTKYVITPVFLYALYSFYKSQNKKEGLLLGLAYGIMGISHSTAFVFATGSMFFFFAYLLYADRKSFAFSLNYLSSKSSFALAFLVGFVLSLIYWFQPIFVLHGQTLLGSQLWSTDDFSNPSVQWGFFWSTMGNLFLNFSSLAYLVLGVLSLVGIFYLVKDRTKLKEHELFIALLFVFTFALTFCYFITMPLLGTNLVPNYLFDMYLGVAGTLLALVGVAYVGSLRPAIRVPLAIGLCLLVLLSAALYYPKFKEDRFIYSPQLPLSEISPQFVSLKEYFDSNHVNNAVVLTANEVGFAMNAITGRGVVLSRRAHNDPFVDFDRYQLDGAIMLYGNDVQKRLKLMKDYNVSYLLYESSWIPLEWQFSNEGKLVGYSDPILLFDSTQKRYKLVANGVKYAQVHGYVDPAVRGSKVKTYDLLLVTLDNYNIDQTGAPQGKGVWNPAIDGSLTEVWSYKENGRYAVLYKVNYG